MTYSLRGLKAGDGRAKQQSVGGRVQQRFEVGGESYAIEGMYEKLVTVRTLATAHLYLGTVHKSALCACVIREC